ncbi:hypothetical protein KC335_g16863, partial [Hortaea werneckii]
MEVAGQAQDSGGGAGGEKVGVSGTLQFATAGPVPKQESSVVATSTFYPDSTRRLLQTIHVSLLCSSTMLRSAVARSGARAGRGFAPRTQWQFRRTFADAPPDRTVLPGSHSASAAGVPQAPVLGENPPPPQQAAPSQVPKEPPPPPSSTPPKPRRRFRKFLLTMFLLTALGYGGGVWYSLQSDNFHDFFTEFVPYGEDVVAYFEEREFRKRFPVKEYNDNKWQQIRGENKVTIGRQSGVGPKAAEKSDSTASSANKVHEGAKPQPEKAQQTP